MQKVVTYENVVFACEKLDQDGEKITGRNVLALTGGDFGTVLKYIRQWREEGVVGLDIPNEIPESLHQEIVKTIWQATQDATAQVKEQITLAESRESEAVDGLCQAERRVAELCEKIEQERGDHRDFQQLVQTEKAILQEQLTSAKNSNQELILANKDKTEKLNAAHIELAELRQAVKYAEGSLSKMEAKVEVMQQKIEDLTKANYTLEAQNAIETHRRAFI